MRKLNLRGQRFGRLTVLKETGKRYNGGVQWLCQCDCGTKCVQISGRLRSGQVRSCGCLHIDSVSVHGATRRGEIPRLYTIWAHMKDRCYYQNGQGFKYCGIKGIQVCNEWKDNFGLFQHWALQNGYKDNLTIDRIDNDGDYTPRNCQWISLSDNVRKDKKYDPQFIEVYQLLYSYRFFKFAE